MVSNFWPGHKKGNENRFHEAGRTPPLNFEQHTVKEQTNTGITTAHDFANANPLP